ncbi:MAG: amino acid ABC transporter permease [Liquorilactobacillus ghanensis]|jgi:putative amino-acid transport system permease protein|uniref:amino acid ABC transporter permease n=2 Tax=Liquorilactobacillus ghanensis TaxID=399370 RepID=UPI0039E881A6
MRFNWQYFINIFTQLIAYIPVTLIMAIFAMLLAIVIGVLITTLQLSSSRIFRRVAQLYISLFRGMPTLVQLFLIYYGLPQFFPSLRGMPAIVAAIIGLGFKESSYLAEIFRAGFNSVDEGQIEAGKSLNIPSLTLFWNIVLPQAALNALPATGNTFVSLLKETSLAFTLGLTELFGEGKMLAGESFNYFETYLAVGVLYWILIIVYTGLQSLIEKALLKPYRRNSDESNRSEKFGS